MPVPFLAPDQERMGVDIRARVLWGDPRESILEDWRKKGAPEGEIQAALERALRERQRHFRIRGAQDIAVSLVFILLGAAAYGFYWASTHGGLSLRTRAQGSLWMASIGLPIAGLAFVFRGVRRLTVGGEVEEAASDLSEFD